jgi:hypothetical protein
MKSYYIIVITCPAPNLPSVCIVNAKLITPKIKKLMEEQCGGFPYWCTWDDDDRVDFDLKKNGFLLKDGELPSPKCCVGLYSYVVS